MILRSMAAVFRVVAGVIVGVVVRAFFRAATGRL
jgi:hypothetical protein